ncbi:MAG: GTPase HflX [Lentimicrobiaceae bacterium]|jgi:GTP-binding protein HflX|nr:GTPase HflX [Lentimicrobiaceae bacterium]
MDETNIIPENAILVGLVTPESNESKTQEHLNELEFLLQTAGGQALQRFVQKLEKPDGRTYVGSGKLEEIVMFAKAASVDVVVFDDELTPSQLRNLEKSLECKILDRTTLILDIFARRARTSTARTQVELAQYQYLLPRLTRMWTHLTKQRGGLGMRGPGEKEIETDRRVIRDRIALLKEKLKHIDKQKTTQRKSRSELVRVALVGYTNVGKSTLMNLISKSDIFAENKLFATLDTTVRKVVIDNLPFLLTDTVGFIRKLPHGLVESFKSTLDEVTEADLLLHVADISHPDFEEQIAVVNQTLREIKAFDKPIIMVFNKVDACPPVVPDTISTELKNSWMAKNNAPAIFISATQKINLEEFKTLLYNEVKKIHAIRYPYNNFLY